MDVLVQKLSYDMTLDWCPSMNSSLHTRQTLDDKYFRCQSRRFVLLRTWKHVISRCKVHSIASVRTLSWEGIEFGNFILIAAIHYWNQPTENSISSSSLECDFVTSLKPGFHYTANATTTTQKQSDYKVEQSSFTLTTLFSLEIGRCRGRNWLYGNQV